MNSGGNAPGGWKVDLLCNHCDQPIAQWDHGVWVHVRMGQIECEKYSAEIGHVAAPPDAASFLHY